MWRFMSVGPVLSETFTVAEARFQLGFTETQTEHDLFLSGLIGSAREHIEKYCNVLFAPRQVVMACDAFEGSDFDHLPLAPIIPSPSPMISYTDPSGAAHDLGDGFFEILFSDVDHLEAQISVLQGNVWPRRGAGTRVKLAATFGFDVLPPPVRQAHALLVAHWFENREAVNIGNSVTPLAIGVDDLLANYRRGA